MRTVFIPVKYTGPIDLAKIDLEALPQSLGIVTTAQFMDRVPEITEYLEKNGKQIHLDKGKQVNPGQLLGCDVTSAHRIDTNVDAFFYIGSGRFHPLGVVMNTKKDVFCFNPTDGQTNIISQKDVDNYHKHKGVNYAKFLDARNIGILVSIKPGQYSFKHAQKIRDHLQNEGKKAYIFVFDTMDAQEMINFPFIDFWINTACPRIADDPDKAKVVDMSELDFIDVKLH